MARENKDGFKIDQVVSWFLAGLAMVAIVKGRSFVANRP